MASTGRPAVLLGDADSDVAAAVGVALEPFGGEVYSTRTGAEATALVRRLSPVLIVLDASLPNVDELVLLGDLTTNRSAATIVVTPAHRHRDVVLALRLGADDVISRPFETDEFVARVQAVLRRVDPSPGGTERGPSAQRLRHEGLEMDFEHGRAALEGRDLRLTPTEFWLLAALVGAPGHCLAREDLIRAVRGHPYAASSRALDVHVARLRGKLRASGETAASLLTVRLSAYQLIVPPGRRGGQPAAPADHASRD